MQSYDVQSHVLLPAAAAAAHGRTRGTPTNRVRVFVTE